jgi:hypothetical protein
MDGRCVEALLTLSQRARIVPEQNDLLLLRAGSVLDSDATKMPKRSSVLFSGQAFPKRPI